MKRFWVLAVIALAAVACQPIDQGPGRGDGPDHGGLLRAGQFAWTKADNISFFRQLPLAEVQPDMILQRRTTMRLIHVDAGYSRVELDSGAVGFVLTAMLEPVPPKAPLVPDKPTLDPPNGLGPLDPEPPAPSGPGIPDVLPPTIDPE